MQKGKAVNTIYYGNAVTLSGFWIHITEKNDCSYWKTHEECIVNSHQIDSGTTWKK